ncbi:MAG: carbohydrate-binding protein, partial [Bacteroidales bacterium]|nr:carbohydrate-binding protein [Bacteroidales bacterium]
DYVLWFEGSNGRGPHEVYCAVRSVFIDGKDAATAILTAEGDWALVTLSNHITLRGLSAGKHTLTVKFNPEGKGYDDNMSHGKADQNDWIARRLLIAKI